MPSRDIGGEAASDGYDTPLAVASRAFSALSTNALSAAASLFTPGVFGREPETRPTPDAALDAAVVDVRRSGRVLPSLLPVSRFEEPLTQVSSSDPAKRTKPRKPRSGGAVVAAEIRQVAEVQIAPEQRADAPQPAPRESVVQAKMVRRADGRRAEVRVRAGEGWKRRRLPKACW